MIGLRVVIVSGDDKTTKKLEEMLRMLGCVIVGRAYDEFAAIKTIRIFQPDFIFIDGCFSFIETAKTVKEGMLAPLIILTGRESEHLDYIRDIWDFDCLEKPVKMETLRIAIEICIEKYRNSIEIRREFELIHSRKTTRNIVERAKEILISNLDITETQALHRIQVMGHRNGISLKDMAEQIILTTGNPKSVSA